LFDPDALDACVDRGVRERLPQLEHHYVGFIDPSGGRRDSFALAVAHYEREAKTVVLDCVRAWAAPFNPSGTISEAAVLLKSYGLATVCGDRYSGEFAAEQFRANGIHYEPSELDRSALYLELLPLVNSRGCLLLDVAELLRELRGLERRRGPSGRDRVDHRPNAHDDVANACAGALTLASSGRRQPVDLERDAFIVPRQSAVDLNIAPHPLPRDQRHYDSPKPYSHPLLDPPESGSATDEAGSPWKF
jgi:hypothetical protein